MKHKADEGKKNKQIQKKYESSESKIDQREKKREDKEIKYMIKNYKGKEAITRNYNETKD